jgi:hypothetical protein
MVNIDDFVGAWKLVAIETRKEDGSIHRSGKRKGYIIYSAEGYMSVAFMKEGRTEFISGDIRSGTVEEKIEAFNGYISYSGLYEVTENSVFHNIEVSLFPNWIGDKQERYYEFDGKRLTLSTPLQLVGGMQLSSHLVWERVG